jgi:hypothetical protein
MIKNRAKLQVKMNELSLTLTSNILQAIIFFFELK